VIASDVHRKQATAGAVARSIAEALKNANYSDLCTATYAVPATVAVPAGYQVNPIAVSHWLPATSSFGSCVGSDSGVQRLVVQVRSAGSVRTTTEEVVVVIRKPCRLPADCT
jgi:hypothetical protein